VYDLFTFAGWEITPSIATCLLTGIFTDTGSFMHSNTSGHTLSVASALMQKGARTSTVAKHTYKGKSLGALKAWGRALQNSFLDTDNHIIYSVITEEDLADFDNIKPSAFEGLVETLNKVPEAKFALFLKQDGAVIKGSLRSDPFKGINVAKIAQLFGGGGHQWASGFSIAGKLARDAEGTWRVL
jgi:phosphoesterase RecJ-like protein